MKQEKPSKKAWRAGRASSEQFGATAEALAEIGRGFYARGWARGTSGNFSAVLRRKPLRLVITSTGLDKGSLTAAHFLELDERGRVVRGTGKPSAEALIHLTLVGKLDAGAVLHTHSVWSTLLSGKFAAAGGLAIEGYEMLKGLEGIATHEHREWLPIVENSQNMEALAKAIADSLDRHPGIHGILIRSHGLYTWGRGLAEAKRHVEILEFLLEVLGRSGEQRGAN